MIIRKFSFYILRYVNEIKKKKKIEIKNYRIENMKTNLMLFVTLVLK